MKFFKDCARCGGKKGQGRKSELCKACSDKLDAEFGSEPVAPPQEATLHIGNTYDGTSQEDVIQHLRDIAPLARRAVADAGWRWLKGMRAFTIVEGDYAKFVRLGDVFVTPCDGKEWLPDLTDEGTRAGLLALVRDAWADPKVELCYLGAFTYCRFPGTQDSGFMTETSAKTLVAALVHAPVRVPEASPVPPPTAVLSSSLLHGKVHETTMSRASCTKLVPVEILPARATEGDVVDFRVGLSHNGADALLLRFSSAELRDLLARLLEERP